MIGVIDTSSLLSLVRYYLPFDAEGKLFRCIESKINAGEIIILDKVYEECKYVAGGIILESLTFLNDRSSRTTTADLLPFPKFFNLTESTFCYGSQKNRLTDIEFEREKNAFLEKADANIILYCLESKDMLIPTELVVITEETIRNNDGKLFKKLPALCDIANIECCTLPEFLCSLDEVNFWFDD